MTASVKLCFAIETTDKNQKILNEVSFKERFKIALSRVTTIVSGFFDLIKLWPFTHSPILCFCSYLQYSKEEMFQYAVDETVAERDESSSSTKSPSPEDHIDLEEGTSKNSRKRSSTSFAMHAFPDRYHASASSGLNESHSGDNVSASIDNVNTDPETIGQRRGELIWGEKNNECRRIKKQ